MFAARLRTRGTAVHGVGLRVSALRSGALACLLLCWMPLCAAAQETSVDGSKLGGVLTLQAPQWRYNSTDQPAFAEPEFPDKDWRLVASDSSLVRPKSVRNEGSMYTWARLHLRINGPVKSLAMALSERSIFPYAVYANGRLVSESPGFKEHALHHAEPYLIALPADREITLAVRIFCPRNVILRTFPLQSMVIGSPEAVAESARMTRIIDFCRVQAGQLISMALALAVATFGTAIFMAQRSRREYLWLALQSFSFVAMTACSVLIAHGISSANPPQMFVWRMSGSLSTVFLLELLPLLTGVRPMRLARPLQVFVLSLPLLSFYSELLFGYLLLVTAVLLIVLLTRYMVHALLRRNPEAMLLSIPMAFLLFGNLLTFASLLFPTRVPFPTILHIGMVGLGADQVPFWLIFLVTFGILQRRFVRVSHTEQRTASELEAARVIQNLLIPHELPTVPGLRFGSVYHPALEVGGDFFQILPSPSGTLIALGDVSGKGVPAAMTVALLVGTLRSAAEYSDSPAAILAALNRVAHGRGTGFTTCLLLSVDRSAARLVVASAGHLEPYLDGIALAIEANLPLGVTPEIQFAEQIFDFHPGQVLTLLTDGVVEAFHPHTRELFGFERAQAVSHLTAEGIAAAISTFTAAATPSDDITILTVAAV